MCYCRLRICCLQSLLTQCLTPGTAVVYVGEWHEGSTWMFSYGDKCLVSSPVRRGVPFAFYYCFAAQPPLLGLRNMIRSPLSVCWTWHWPVPTPALGKSLINAKLLYLQFILTCMSLSDWVLSKIMSSLCSVLTAKLFLLSSKEVVLLCGSSEKYVC